jgi:carnosine N-methyltransferase
VNLFSICPWVHQSINVLKSEDQVKEVWFPDINPSNIACQDGQFSMAAGDFLEVKILLRKPTWK